MRIKIAYFEIVNQCNLNCATCYNRSGLNHKREEISVEQLKNSIDTLLDVGITRVLIGGGEPTLHSHFDDVLNLVDEYPQLSFGVVTNGIVHNQKLIQMYKTRDNFTMQISLDGSCEEQNAKIRGRGNFAKTDEFAKLVQNDRAKPLIKMVITQNNYDDVESFYRYAVSRGGIPEYAFVNKLGNGKENWVTMPVSAKQKLKVIKLIAKLNEEYGISAFLPMCTHKCPLSDDTTNLSVNIKVDGSIQPCQTLYDAYFTLGNIFDFRLDEFNKRLEFVSNIARERVETDYNCGRCILKKGCKKGCMATAYTLTGDPLASDDECDFRKLQLVGYDMNYLLEGRQ